MFNRERREEISAAKMYSSIKTSKREDETKKDEVNSQFFFVSLTSTNC